MQMLVRFSAMMFAVASFTGQAAAEVSVSAEVQQVNTSIGQDWWESGSDLLGASIAIEFDEPGKTIYIEVEADDDAGTQLAFEDKEVDGGDPAGVASEGVLFYPPSNSSSCTVYFRIGYVVNGVRQAPFHESDVAFYGD